MSWRDEARRQHGAISTKQLVSHGLTARNVATLRSRGELQPTGVRGVQSIAGAPSTRMSADWIAVLGSGAPLSHQSAARVWGLAVPAAQQIHVSIPHARRVRLRGAIRVHRVSGEDISVTRVRGLLVTDRVTTVLDCAASLPRVDAMALLDRARQRKIVGLRDVRDRLDRQSGRTGNAQLRWLLREASEGDALSERRLHRLLRAAGITEWRATITIAAMGGYEADVLFARQRLILEVDGYGVHTERERFETDRERQNRVQNRSQEWLILRFTWRNLVSEQDHVLAEVRSALRRRDALAR